MSSFCLFFWAYISTFYSSIFLIFLCFSAFLYSLVQVFSFFFFTFPRNRSRFYFYSCISISFSLCCSFCLVSWVNSGVLTSTLLSCVCTPNDSSLSSLDIFSIELGFLCLTLGRGSSPLHPQPLFLSSEMPSFCTERQVWRSSRRVSQTARGLGPVASGSLVDSEMRMWDSWHLCPKL